MTSPASQVPADRPRTGLLAGAIAILLAFLFAPSAMQLASVYRLDANYAHGYFIVPIALWLAWRIARDNPIPDEGKPLLGTVTLLFGLTLHLVAVILRFPPIDWLSLMLTLHGATLILGGREWAGRFWFPILFLTFLFPLPAQLADWVAIRLQDIVAAISTHVLSWFYVCVRRGNNIYLAGVDEPLFVAQECSGIRQAIAFIAMGALFAHIAKLGFLRGLAVVALAVPIAIAANAVRVILMGFGLVFFGPSWFTTWMHDVPAMFTLPLGVFAFFGLVWLVLPDKVELKTPDARPEAAP